MKYLVMECHPAYAVVLDQDGKFLKVANMHYEVGQFVTDIVELSLPKKNSLRRWTPMISALAACLVLMFTSVFLTMQRPYASVYLSINPEVRVDVNRNDMVVGIEGINEDGKTLLTGYEYRKKNLDTVMDELVDRAIDMGYLHEGGKITLSLDADENWVVAHEDHLNEQINQKLTGRIEVVIDIDALSPQEEVTVPSVSPETYGDSAYDGHTDYEDDFDDSPDGHTDYDELESKRDDGQTDYDDWDDDSDYDDPEDD